MSSDELVAVIREQLETMNKTLAAIHAATLTHAPGAASRAAKDTKEVWRRGQDYDLSNAQNDPVVRFEPKWIAKEGIQSCVGMRFSECPADYLDRVQVGFHVWKSNNPQKGKEQYVGADLRTAGLAQQWAERNRQAPPAQLPIPEAIRGAIDDSEIPF